MSTPQEVQREGKVNDVVGALHRFEQRLEQLVTGAFARAFRSAVQPMEIAAALQREVDNSAQILSRDRRLAPNMFTIDLSASDFDRLSTYGDTMSRELAAMLHEHAESQHYMFTGPVSLNFTRSEDLTTGRFRVRSEASAAVTPAVAPSMSDTAISRTPLFLEVNGSLHPLESPGLTIGRGTGSDLRIDDPGVSRRHVEFRVQPGTGSTSVSVVDLGSTNGTTVNGQRVQHAVLGDGSVVLIGSTRIVVHVGAPSRGPDEPSRRPQSATGSPAPAAASPSPYPPYPPQYSHGSELGDRPPPFTVPEPPPGHRPPQRPGNG